VTQPRKEQVKNLKTKYTRFTGVGTLSIGGGPVQTVLNSVLEAFYDNFLSVTKTGIVGGAETSAPAILYGGQGPFPLLVGDSFTLSITGLNGGTAFPVAVQAGDIVILGGSPVVTTARMADRINLIATGYGATVPVAANVKGRLVLTSATASGVLFGDSAVMTIAEVTSGILNVLGFTLVSSATAVGTTAPKRGVVTVSSDGLGGTVQLRKLDTSISEALNSVMRHTLAGVYVPETVHGQPIYARLTAFPGAVINGRNLKFSFYRTGPVRPHVVTSTGAAKSNFSTLSGADSVAVNLVFGNGQTLNRSGCCRQVQHLLCRGEPIRDQWSDRLDSSTDHLQAGRSVQVRRSGDKGILLLLPERPGLHPRQPSAGDLLGGGDGDPHRFGHRRGGPGRAGPGLHVHVPHRVHPRRDSQPQLGCESVLPKAASRKPRRG